MKKLIDFIGNTYGDWTVLYEVERDKHNKRQMYCRCKCGVERVVSAYSLTKGSSTGCGCRRSSNCIVDISGQIFGHMLALEITSQRSHKHCIWKCKCLLCGRICYVSSNCLLRGTTTSCGCLKSKSELVIANFLDNHNIRYQRQKKFVGCRNKRPLLFDFYLPDYNIAVEYDGEFHYQEIQYCRTTLKERNKRDAIKTKYCEENDIILIRIPYWEKDDIESILDDRLFLYSDEEANHSDFGLSA